MNIIVVVVGVFAIYQTIIKLARLSFLTNI